jgi:putative ubiquitin-RnfH superfamily antitoxin RatB of RatAB toxin-antitoxin module
MKIAIAYAVPGRQVLITHNVAEGTTLQAAIESSGILEQLPHVDLQKNKVGIFGKAKPLDTELAEGDRIEIYFPVTVDPKTLSKRKPAAQKKATAEPDSAPAGETS